MRGSGSSITRPVGPNLTGSSFFGSARRRRRRGLGRRARRGRRRSARGGARLAARPRGARRRGLAASARRRRGLGGGARRRDGAGGARRGAASTAASARGSACSSRRRLDDRLAPRRASSATLRGDLGARRSASRRFGAAPRRLARRRLGGAARGGAARRGGAWRGRPRGDAAVLGAAADDGRAQPLLDEVGLALLVERALDPRHVLDVEVRHVVLHLDAERADLRDQVLVRRARDPWRPRRGAPCPARRLRSSSACRHAHRCSCSRSSSSSSVPADSCSQLLDSSGCVFRRNARASPPRCTACSTQARCR